MFCINVTKESYTWALHKANKFSNCFIYLGTVPQISVWSRGKKKKKSIKQIGEGEKNHFCTKCYLLPFPKSSSLCFQKPYGLSSSLPCCHVIPPSSNMSIHDCSQCKFWAPKAHEAPFSQPQGIHGCVQRRIKPKSQMVMLANLQSILQVQKK